MILKDQEAFDFFEKAIMEKFCFDTASIKSSESVAGYYKFKDDWIAFYTEDGKLEIEEFKIKQEAIKYATSKRCNS